MSQRYAKVFKVKLDVHPNADKMFLINIPETQFVYCAAKDSWSDYEGKLAAFIEPQSIFNIGDERFLEFLETCPNGRIKAKKLRGIISSGICLKQPDNTDWYEGKDVWEELNLTHYDPEVEQEMSGKKGSSEEQDTPPSGDFPKYDVENFRKYADKVFQPNEPVWITEKLHGQNSCYVFKNGRMHCRSRNLWKKEWGSKPQVNLDDLRAKGVSEENIEKVRLRIENWTPTKNQWWAALDRQPEIRAFCEANEGVALFGELYGAVKGFKYDTAGGETGQKFRAFDVLKDGKWMNAEEAYNLLTQFNVPYVPLISHSFLYDFNKIVEMSEGNSLLNEKHIREGVVFKPLIERWERCCGRVLLKAVNIAYLEKN